MKQQELEAHIVNLLDLNNLVQGSIVKMILVLEAGKRPQIGVTTAEKVEEGTLLREKFLEWVESTEEVTQEASGESKVDESSSVTH